MLIAENHVELNFGGIVQSIQIKYVHNISL